MPATTNETQIKPEFLALKFSSLPTVPELRSDEKKLIQFGWKCRKSIRWRDIHVGADDRDILKSAGDDLVDKKKVPMDSIGRLYEIRLNASKWNPGNDKFDRQPRVRDSWERLANAMSIANQFPEYVHQQLSQYHPDWLKVASSCRITQCVWFLSEVSKLFGEEFTLESDLFADEASTVGHARKWISRQYQLQGAKPPTCEDLEGLCARIATDVGLGAFTIHEVEVVPIVESSGRKLVCECINQDSPSFISIKVSREFRVVQLNSAHPFFLSAEALGVEWCMKSLAIAVADTINSMNLSDGHKEDLLCTLNLELKKQSTKSKPR